MKHWLVKDALSVMVGAVFVGIDIFLLSLYSNLGLVIITIAVTLLLFIICLSAIWEVITLED